MTEADPEPGSMLQPNQELISLNPAGQINLIITLKDSD